MFQPSLKFIIYPYYSKSKFKSTIRLQAAPLLQRMGWVLWVPWMSLGVGSCHSCHSCCARFFPSITSFPPWAVLGPKAILATPERVKRKTVAMIQDTGRREKMPFYSSWQHWLKQASGGGLAWLSSSVREQTWLFPCSEVFRKAEAHTNPVQFF